MFFCSSDSSFCLNHDAKVRHSGAPGNKNQLFRQKSMWRRYDICDNIGEPCHNCRKEGAKKKKQAFCFAFRSLFLIFAAETN